MKPSKYSFQPPKNIPTDTEVQEMVDYVHSIYPAVSKENVVKIAIQKYYHQVLFKENARKGVVGAKHFLLSAQSNTCYYCGKYLLHIDATVDHKLPLSRGGLSDIDNMCISCSVCNMEKQNMTEVEYLQYKKDLSTGKDLINKSTYATNNVLSS